VSWISTLPVWATALLIFGLRIGDVSLGTLRTLSVVQSSVEALPPLPHATGWRAVMKKK